MELLSAVVGALGGALATTFGSHVLARPKLQISVLDVGIDPLQTDDHKGISKEVLARGAKDFLITPPEYHQLLERHGGAPVPEREYQHPQLYTMDLYKIARDNEHYKIYNSVMKRTVMDLRRNLNSNIPDEFISVWFAAQRTIHGHLVQQTRRGNFLAPTVDESKPERFRRTQDKDGDYLVTFGNFNVVFVHSSVKTHQDEVKQTCESVSAALSTFDADALEKIVSFLEDLNFDDPIIHEVERATTEQLRDYSKVFFRIAITNSGRTGASVLGRAKVKLLCEDYVLDRGKGRTLKEDISFDVHAIQEGGIAPIDSVTISAGACESALFASDEVLVNLDREEIFELLGTERKFEICLTSNGRQELKTRAKFSPSP